MRYRYLKGKPDYVEIATTPSDLSSLWGYDTRYLQANWHGDLVRRVWLNGDASTEMAYDPWGNGVRGLHYYEWNGAWGYLTFGALQLYYVHGRWYNPDTGMWLSPNEKGDYMYGGDGQDAVNYAVGYLNTISPAQFGDLDLQALKYKDMIKREAEIYGVPWQVVAGILESEFQLDTHWYDRPRDWLLRIDPFICDAYRIVQYCQNPAGGIGNIHILTAQSAAMYMAGNYGWQNSMQLNIQRNEFGGLIEASYLLPDFGSITVMAAHIRQLAD